MLGASFGQVVVLDAALVLRLLQRRPATLADGVGGNGRTEPSSGGLAAAPATARSAAGSGVRA